MNLDVKFSELSREFDIECSESLVLSDGGFDAGYEKGFGDGYADGYTKGSTDGYSKGRADGKAEGYSAGHAAGLAKGETAGHAKGYADGYAAGYEAGYQTGREEGYAAGYEEGDAKGYTKGYTEGYEEGIVNAPKPILQEKIITENGEYIPSEDVDGFSKVVVNVAESKVNPLDYAVSIGNMFCGVRFPSGTELEVSFGSKAGATAQGTALQRFLYDAKGLKSIKVVCGAKAPETTSLDGIARCSIRELELERIDFSEAQQLLVPSTLSRTFEWRSGLKEVLGEFDLTKCTTVGSIASQCSALETIRFKVGTIMKSLSFAYSPLLTDETIQSIIDGLADLTTGTTQTLTLHANVGAKLTDEQKASASAKNWTISY